MDNNSSKSFFQVSLLNFITKLEKTAGHDECRPPQLVNAGGLAVLVKSFTLIRIGESYYQS